MQAICVAVASVSADEGAKSRRASKPRSSTRERILVSSLSLFASRGFDGTDIVDIEEAVGLTPGSGGFYRHFKNKEDVLRAAIDAEIARVQEHHRSLAKSEATADPAEDLAQRVELMLEMLGQMRNLMAVMAHDNDRFPDLLAKVGAAMADSGVAIDADELESLLQRCSAPSHPPLVVATILTMAGTGFTLAEMLFGRPVADVDREQFGRVLTELVLGRAST
jgi:AcrR family transcriptional regulator